MENNELKDFVGDRVERMKTLHKDLTFAYWGATLSGKDEDYKNYSDKEILFKKFFNNEGDFGVVKKFIEEGVGDEIQKRELKLLYDSYLSNQGDVELLVEISEKVSDVEKKFNTFRAVVDGEEKTYGEVCTILKDEKDSLKLEKVWDGYRKVGGVVNEDVLEIVRLRNKLARSLGFDNYYEFSLEVSEQKEKNIERIFNELDDLIREPFEKLKGEIDLSLSKKFGVEIGELKPWHYGDLFFAEGPSIYSVDLDGLYEDGVLDKAKKYYESIGMDVDGILEGSSLYEQEGKYPHAYCIDMDREGDVRTMQNLRNDEKYMETLLHELGHGVYGKGYASGDLPFILRDSAHTFTTEAVAMIFGRKSKSLNFIKNCCGVKIGNDVEKMLRLRQLVFSRWAQVMFRFERELYKNPEQDLNKFWWDLVGKYQLVDFCRDAPDWASKIHIVSCPVYYHNYMLGELLASQFHNYIMKNFNCDESYFGCVEVGDYFKEKVFGVGARYRWDEMIRLATGEDLSARYFVGEFL